MFPAVVTMSVRCDMVKHNLNRPGCHRDRDLYAAALILGRVFFFFIATEYTRSCYVMTRGLGFYVWAAAND